MDDGRATLQPQVPDVDHMTVTGGKGDTPAAMQRPVGAPVSPPFCPASLLWQPPWLPVRLSQPPLDPALPAETGLTSLNSHKQHLKAGIVGSGPEDLGCACNPDLALLWASAHPQRQAAVSHLANWPALFGLEVANAMEWQGHSLNTLTLISFVKGA